MHFIDIKNGNLLIDTTCKLSIVRHLKLTISRSSGPLYIFLQFVDNIFVVLTKDNISYNKSHYASYKGVITTNLGEDFLKVVIVDVFNDYRKLEVIVVIEATLRFTFTISLFFYVLNSRKNLLVWNYSKL